MFNPQSLPLIQKINTITQNQQNTMSCYHRICLSIIIPHGSTDAWLFPHKHYLINYGTTMCLFGVQSLNLKFVSLFLYSIYHMKNDIRAVLPLQLLYSCALHVSWVFYPEWSLTYLAWIHTSLHYSRVFHSLNQTRVLALFLMQIFVFLLLKKYEEYDLPFNGLWIPIVIGHITTNG